MFEIIVGVQIIQHAVFSKGVLGVVGQNIAAFQECIGQVVRGKRHHDLLTGTARGDVNPVDFDICHLLIGLERLDLIEIRLRGRRVDHNFQGSLLFNNRETGEVHIAGNLHL